MSSLSNYREGKTKLEYFDVKGKRKTIHLGSISKRNALAIQLRVDELLACMFCGTSPDRATLEWVASISVVLRTKLARHNLIDAGNLPLKVKKTSIREFLDKYLEKRKSGMKPATIIVWSQVVESLIKHMPKRIAIQDINAGHASDWLDKLRAEKYAATTIHKRISFARQFFGDAIRHKLIKENPFSSIKVSRPKPKSNVEVPRDAIEKVMAVCDPTWKAIVALSRYGGLRCPSEVLTIKWSEIDFKRGRMTITAVKNEHHDGGGIRECPLFPEVREAIKDLPRVDEYVIDKPEYRAAANTKKGWANANLRTNLLKRLKAANVEPWPRIFHSMRASRQTELELEFGRTASCAWLGNTEAVAVESYLMIFEEDWQRAINGAQQNAQHKVRKVAKSSAKQKRSDQ